jgi:hypothetical protein
MAMLVKINHHPNFLKDTHRFLEPDTQQLFQTNLKRLGPTWYYANHPIEYKFNSHGYRMREFDTIDYANHLAFFGCSFTVGVGLPLEETFAYRTATTLGCDYVNGSIGGASNQFIVANLVEYLSQVPHLPRAIIINWTFIARNMYWTTTDGVIDHVSKLTDFKDLRPQYRDKFTDSYREYIMDDDHRALVFKQLRTTAKTLCKLAGIPLVEFTMCQSPGPGGQPDNSLLGSQLNDIKFIHPRQVNDGYPTVAPDTVHLEYARDINPATGIAHPGFNAQQRAYDYIIERIHHYESTNLL